MWVTQNIIFTKLHTHIISYILEVLSEHVKKVNDGFCHLHRHFFEEQINTFSRTFTKNVYE